jgi:ubiquinone/menaquinone biosynthesis C-methylase UbiE
VTSEGPSVAFDRAASFYDHTRQLSSQAAARIIDTLTNELRGRGTCLEIGVGTGRIGIPVHESGIPLVGVDLSSPMLKRLVEKGGGRAPFPVAVADATKLPFADGALGAAYGAHVLHLIPPWREAVWELARVVRPRGVVLIDIGEMPVAESPLDDVTDRVHAGGRHAPAAPRPRGRGSAGA